MVCSWIKWVCTTHLKGVIRALCDGSTNIMHSQRVQMHFTCSRWRRLNNSRPHQQKDGKESQRRVFDPEGGGLDPHVDGHVRAVRAVSDPRTVGAAGQLRVEGVTPGRSSSQLLHRPLGPGLFLQGSQLFSQLLRLLRHGVPVQGHGPWAAAVPRLQEEVCRYHCRFRTWNGSHRRWRFFLHNTVPGLTAFGGPE